MLPECEIVEDFAGGWYSKRNWQGEISEHDAEGFVAVAIDKLRAEIAREDLAGQAING